MVRGVAPVVASLLLILISVAAITAAYFLVVSYTQSAGSRGEPSQLREIVKVEAVEHRDSKLVVYLANIGPRKTTISSVFIITPGGVAVSSATGLALEVEPGSSTSVTVEAPKEAGAYILKLVTASGVEFSFPLSLHVASKPVEPERPPETGEPLFAIADLSGEIVGTVSSTRAFTVTVENKGGRSGTVIIRVYDHLASIAAESRVSLQPGERRTESLELKLPPLRGVYTWVVKAENEEEGRVDDERSFRVEARDLYLKARSAAYADAFEEQLQGWIKIGGSWQIVRGSGVGGSGALEGDDDGSGLGGAPLLYREAPRTVFREAAFQFTKAKGAPIRVGLALLDDSRRTFYAVSVNYRGVDRGLRLEYFDGYRWTELSSARFNPAGGEWYSLLLRWSPTSIEAYIYDSGGATKASLSYRLSGYTPAYVALLVDEGAAYFDNFIIGGDSLAEVQVAGLQEGWRAELYTGGGVIATAVADSSGSCRFSVISNLIVLGAGIRVRDATGGLVIDKVVGDVVGGDVYFYGA